MTTIPDLDRLIQKFTSIGRDLTSQKQIAQVYAAGVGLLYHLKNDQITLQRIGANQTTEQPCPAPEETPAMTAVLQNTKLFSALLNCLSTTIVPPENDPVDRTVVGRKRSLSFNTSEPSKLAKLVHSPVPSAARKVGAAAAAADSAAKPNLPIPVLAATILFAALAHLDHWPAPLVKAYADDMFGPRVWVEDPRCRLLVENLALVHMQEISVSASSDSSSNPALSVDAALVADAYRNWNWNTSLDRDTASKTSAPDFVRRGSLSSDSSSVNVSVANSIKKKEQDLMSVSIPSKRRKLVTCSKIKKDSNDAVSDLGIEKDYDSSSGEEDEEVLLTTNSNGGAKKTIVNESTHSREDSVVSMKQDTLYPVFQRNLNLELVRQRFFDTNAELAQNFVASSLSERLDVRSKQNSGLLQRLPSFTKIPEVRSLIARNLSKWLQSPALAGLARSLFSATVNDMKNADPPLPDDLSAIDSILGMKLKANQLGTHVENITAIARLIPTASVVQHMYSKLIVEQLELEKSGGVVAESNCIDMIAAIHKVVSPQVSYDAIASTLMTILVQPPENGASAENGGRSQRNELVQKLRHMIRLIAFAFGRSFNDYQLIEAFLSLDVSSGTWSPKDEEDKARLMFQCVTLSAARFSEGARENGGKELSAEDLTRLRDSLMSAKKLLLTWCCTDYGPRCSIRKRKKFEGYSEGAGSPDFRSALKSCAEEKIPTWLNTMRCLLFVEDGDSELMQYFVMPDGVTDGNDLEWRKEVSRIKICCDYGGDITNELLWIVIKASTSPEVGLDSEMGIQLIENLIEGCGKNRRGKLHVNDPIIVWELYNLVEFTPERSKRSTEEIPRLAYPGLWWRVTMIALVLCVFSVEIGSVVWKDHPTLRALMKMITSMRYRFPTVDCDENSREEMKQAEQTAREKELSVAERLFLPPKKENVTKMKSSGSRVSRRLLQQQQEREAARELGEKNRLHKMLRSASKSIMLWDPDGPARKPPREAADLLVSVEELFGLSDRMQRSTSPDYLSLTIGNTTRGAVEKAYEWILPIIATMPETIARLQSSTSCFLLLRAYGAEGEERKQLKELSAPLLHHVQESLAGHFGVDDAVKAFDLLMSDIASPNPERRRCARRVLRDALRTPNGSTDRSGGWMANIARLKHANFFVTSAVEHMAKSAAFERGGVLRSIVLALEHIIGFAKKRKVEVKRDFEPLVVDLISRRPGVFAEAIDTYSDLRELLVRVLHVQFVSFVENSEMVTDSEKTIEITLYNSDAIEKTVKLPLPLVRSISVLLSAWRDEYKHDEPESSNAVEHLISSLLRANDGAEDVRGKDDMVSVELWIMLVKARSDSIARRAALTAPTTFLPRLLLCSGLSHSSLVAMVDRLGKLGGGSEDLNDTYQKLFDSSTSSAWDIGRLGHKRDIYRRLHGRISAYLRLNPTTLSDVDSDVSKTFLDWLSNACAQPDERPRKSKHRKQKISAAPTLKNLTSASSVVAGLKGVAVSTSELKPLVLHGKSEAKNQWVTLEHGSSDYAVTADDCHSFLALVAKLVEMNDFLALERQLSILKGADTSHALEIAVQILKSFHTLEHAQNGLVMSILKWIPSLSEMSGSPDLWSHIFSLTLSDSFSSNLLLKCIESWSHNHVSECRRWICQMEDDNGMNGLNVELLAQYLVLTSGKPSPHIHSFSDSTKDGNDRLDDILLKGCISVASRCLRRSTEPQGECGSHRNSSLGFDLAILVGCSERASFKSVCEMALKEATRGRDSAVEDVFGSLLVRLYLLRPRWMNLGLEEIRSLLMKVSSLLPNDLASWPSSLDDELEDMIDSARSGNLRLIKRLSDVSRNHPIILLRKSASIKSALEMDASVTRTGDEEIRGIVHGQSISPPREARLSWKTVKVTVRHWGFSYTEPVWVAFLDVVASCPAEVLFGCGLGIGLLDLLSVYLQLISVQLQLLSTNKATRLKSKLSEVFASFQKHNSVGWRQWLGSSIEKTEVRHILMSCEFITPQEAIESLRVTAVLDG